MSVNFDEVIQAYLKDIDYQEFRKRRQGILNSSISPLQEHVLRFIRSEINLEKFRNDLDKLLRRTGEWGAHGMGFMMQLHNFGKYHSGPDGGRTCQDRNRPILRQNSTVSGIG